MSDFPVVTAILPTFNRPAVLKKAIAGLLDNLEYDGEFRILIGNDGDALPDEFYHIPSVSIIDGPHRGLGANLNRLLWTASEIVLQMDDDHILIKKLKITPHVLKLKDDNHFGIIRLMCIAGHHYHAVLRDSYWEVSWNSPEVYIASNRPHLKHRRVLLRYGTYPENQSLGKTEEGFCHTCKVIGKVDPEAPIVAIPLDVLTESSWDHIGESWQLKGY